VSKRNRNQRGPRPAGPTPPPLPQERPFARPTRTWRTWGWIAAAVIIAVGALVYANSFRGIFLFDDYHSILENRHVTRPLTWERVPWMIEHDVRPVVTMSLALNYKLGLDKSRPGKDPSEWGFHLVNLAIHVGAALLLFGIVRRTLLTERLRKRFESASTPVALAAALIWMVHPLQTSAVTYIIQRAESAMGMFFLLCLYSAIRGFDARGTARGLWFAAAVISTVMGMWSKQVMAVVPVIVLLYDLVFVSRSSSLVRTLVQAYRRHWPLYLGLLLTWVIPAVQIIKMLGDEAFSSTVHTDIAMRERTLMDYVTTQFSVVLHYIRIILWPDPLCLDYYWQPAPRTFMGVGLPAIVLFVLVAATVVALWKVPPVGFLGAWFFVILSPSSTIVPLADLAFEHRLYLSLAAFAVGLTAGGYLLLRRLIEGEAGSGEAPRRAMHLVGIVLVAVVVVVLGGLTVIRNKTYHSEAAAWRDVLRANPDNPRAHNNLGKALYFERKAAMEEDGPDAAKRIEDPEPHFAQAIRLEANYADPRYNMGLVLAEKGDRDDAIRYYRTAIELKRNFPQAYNNLAILLDHQAQEKAAAARQERKKAEETGNEAQAARHRGRAAELEAESRELTRDAVNNFRNAVGYNPYYTYAYNNLAALLSRRAGRIMAEADRLYAEASRLSAEASKLEGEGKTQAARAARQKAEQARAQADKQRAQAEQNLDRAMKDLDRAYNIDPYFADVHFNRGLIKMQLAQRSQLDANRLAREGRPAEAERKRQEALARRAEAIEAWQTAVNLKPGMAEVHQRLAQTFLSAGRRQEAIGHLMQVVRLQPRAPQARNNLARALLSVGRARQAAGHFGALVQLAPKNVQARDGYAQALFLAGEYAAAAQQYREALGLKGDAVPTLRRAALLLATCPDDRVRDGKAAVQLADRACQLTNNKDLGSLNALAAAYAEVGRFDRAVDTQREAMELVRQADPKQLDARRRAALLAGLEQRLKLFGAGRALRISPKKPPPPTTRPGQSGPQP